MNTRIAGILITLTLLISGCEEEKEIKCFPQRIVTKGDAGTTSLTADYKYVGDTLDHIVWSNYETHFYFYNQAGQLSKVARKNVQTYRKIESELIYEDGLEVRRDEYLMNLNRSSQEDLDTSLIGYIEFEYSGLNIAAEKVYTLDDQSGEMGLKFYKEYEYDLSGNIITYICLDYMDGDTTEAFSYVYDTQNNPFSSINMLFVGDSYINNKIKTTDLLKDEVYVHTMTYTVTDFPEQMIMKQGSINFEIVTITYTCK